MVRGQGEPIVDEYRAAHWWEKLLQAFCPVERIVTPAAPVDPVVEIGLPSNHPQKDASLVSAYYLTFYE